MLSLEELFYFNFMEEEQKKEEEEKQLREAEEEPLARTDIFYN